MLAYDVASSSQIEIEIQAIKRLWLEAFPEDDEDAFDSYCQGRLVGVRCFVYIYQQELASMAFSITSNMVGISHCHSETVNFIVGVATEEKWRGRGLASVILHKIADQAQLCGCSCLLLSTYIPQFYLKLGYQEAAWHRLWRLRNSVAKCQNSESVFACSESDLAALATYYNKHKQCGWLERSRDYWRWRFKDAGKIYGLKNYEGQISAYAILNKGNECEELLSDTSQGVAELIKVANLIEPFEIGSAKLNDKLPQDTRFEEVGLGSCQMILPLTERCRDEYSCGGVNLSCLDNW